MDREVAARQALAAADPVMARLIERHGALGFETRRRGRPATDAFAALIRIVTGQQVSVAAARTIHGRMLELFDGREPSPIEICEAGEDHLRTAGLSGRKASYICDLARAVVAGEFDPDQLSRIDDEQVIEAISARRGFGRWSAEMFCMFALERPDVFSGGDLGLRRGIQRAYALSEPPTPELASEMADRWRPHRTHASIYLWAEAGAPG